MTFPQILSVAAANPPSRFSQSELHDILLPYLGHNERAAPIFENAGISHRHIVVAPDYYAEERTTRARNECYLSESVPLGEAAIQACLRQAGMSPDDVDDLTIVSCTGIDTPGLDLLLAGRMGMRPDLKRTSILGMGCYGALPGLARAFDSAVTHPRRSLVLSLELCSLHFQPHDDSVENIVCSALFGDGAAAALVSSREEEPSRWPRIVDSATYTDYSTLDQMAFHLTDHGFRMRLGSYVPKILAASIEQVVDGFLARSGLSRADVRVWGVHPGSARILAYTQERLGLPENALACSYDVLNRYGNMSSVTILFILAEIQRTQQPAPGDYGVLLAFGPGLTIESMLLQW